MKETELIPTEAKARLHSMLGNLLAVLDTRGTDMYDRDGIVQDVLWIAY